MHRIQLNATGTRTMDVTDENMKTIEKYDLFNGLVDSTGYIDESVLDKLKLNIRSMIATDAENCKDLLDLCIDVIYHEKMKAYGLRNLIEAYQEWIKNNKVEE